MFWNVCFIFIFSVYEISSMESYYQPPRSFAVWGYFTPPLLQRLPLQPQQTAMEAMVELTNNLGVAILQDHSFSRGNFAFSPYGVASVLVVLYEGARSESARQIHRAVRFPLDKDVIRIGFRDIHRHLRSYFSHEGYLSGISLNKQSSSLKPEYKKILKFYGYDVDLNLSLDDEDEVGSGNNIWNTSSTSSDSKKTTASSPHTVVTEAPGMSPGMGDLTHPYETEKQDVNSTTEFPTISTVHSFSLQTTRFPLNSNETDMKQSTETTLMSTTIPTTVMDAFAQNPTADEIESKETVKPVALETEAVKTTTELPVTKLQDETTVLMTETTSITESEEDEFQINLTVGNNVNCKERELACSNNEITTAQTDTFLTEETVTESEEKTTENEIEDITNTNLDNGMLIPQPDDGKATAAEKSSAASKLQSPYEITTSTTETAFQGITESSQMEHDFRREAKSELKLPKEVNSYNIENIKDLINSRASLWLGEKPKSRKTRTITDYLKAPHNLDLSLQLQNGMYDTHVSRNADLYRKLPRLLFLVDGAVDTPVPMMIYTNVFSYAYVPRLHSKALEFPLDDVRYKLLILLPVERRGLRQLIYDLADFPLSNVLDILRPARVKAMVPTFMVEGFVILTSSLQKLGIWDVFDPRKANLSGMSTDPELYVRNVEQSVTVVIRNYVEILDIQTRTMAARQMEYKFEATHPFLYFVLDTATNVALMAGQILDPLNSRIY